MRVLVNRFITLGRKTGIGHYTAALLRCLHQQTSPGEIDAFPAGLAWNLGRACAGLRPLLTRGEKAHGPRDTKQISTPGDPSFRQKTLAWVWKLTQSSLARQLRKTLARNRYDLYHEPNFIPLPCDQPTVTTLHDLSALLHPEWHPARRALFFEKNLVSSLPRSLHFFAISEFTRQEVIRVLHIPPERVTRTYMGIHPHLKPLSAEITAAGLRRLGLPPRYLLHVGTIEPRKNLLLLLRAYCSLPNDLRQRWPLLLAGGWGWGSDPVAKYLQEEGQGQGVIQVGYVPDQDLPILYNGARALVFPSNYEGFGLPPMEMMACGGAVLASTAGALVETVGGHAHLLDPQDLDGWRHALTQILTDNDWWQTLRTGVIEHAQAFTWDRCAADTLQVYHSLSSARTTMPHAA